MSTVSEVRPSAEEFSAAPPMIRPNFNASAEVDARTSLVAWWGECMAVLGEMAATAKRISKLAGTPGHVFEWLILPDDLNEFAEELEKLAMNLPSNPPMPGMELRDPTADLPPVDPAKLAAADAARDTAKRIANLPPELRRRMLQREDRRDLELNRHGDEHRADTAPSMEVATSDSLAVLFAAALEFKERYYPSAEYINLSISLPGSAHLCVGMPLWTKGGA